MPSVWCIGDNGYAEQIDSADRVECLEHGGSISDPNAIEPPGGGFCFVRDVLTKALSQNILRLGGTYELAVAFRDEILTKTPVGRQMLKHYYKYLPNIFAAVASDPQLLLISINAWQSTWPVANAMLIVKRRPKSRRGTPDPAETKLPTAQHKEISQLARRIARGSKDKAFQRALTEFEREWRRYAGADAGRALEIRSRKKR